MIILFLLALFWINPLFADAPSHAGYATVLKKVVRPDGVRWDLFGAEEKKLISEYMASLEKASLANVTDRNEQLAFWLNAHNACVMKLILDHLPIEDVMKIPGFRDKLFCNIAGSNRTLVDMESGVIRPMFSEPKTLFVLWWGTRGGAKLPDQPYEGATLDKVLAEKTKDALSDKRFVEFKTPTSVELSPLFDWFKGDFGTTDDAVLGFIKQNMPKEKAGKIPTKIKNAKFMAFDWSLDTSKQ